MAIFLSPWILAKDTYSNEEEEICDDLKYYKFLILIFLSFRNHR